MTVPRECKTSRVPASRIAPPPVPRIIGWCCVSSSIICASRVRNAGSPSISKIVATLTPVRASSSWSESKNGRWSRFASNCPMVVLPDPIKPIKKMFCVCTELDVFESIGPSLNLPPHVIRCSRLLFDKSCFFKRKKGAIQTAPFSLSGYLRYQLTVPVVSVRMRGVRKMSISVLSVFLLVLLNKAPRYGTSPNNGTLSTSFEVDSS